MNPGIWRGAHSFQKDEEVLKHKVAPGTIPRVLQIGRPYAGIITFFLFLVVLDAATGVVNPLIYRQLINRGILAGDPALIVKLALLAAGVTLVDSALTFWQRQIAARIGLEIVFDLRTRVFVHIQQMSLAFFTRARTGALVSRLNSDVSGVRDAFTDILSTAVGNLVTVTLVLATMFALSWRLTLAALVLVPVFLLAARWVGRRLRALTRESYDRAAEMNNLMVERFNVAGAMVTKIFGRPEDEKALFVRQASRVRDIGLTVSTYARLLFIGLSLVASLAVTVVYGWGGVEAARHTLDVGTVVALVSYLIRLYGPLTALSNLQVDVMTTLVSFERVLEVLDLQPTVTEKPNARAIPPGPVRIRACRLPLSDGGGSVPRFARIGSRAEQAPGTRDPPGGEFRGRAGSAGRLGRPVGSGQDHARSTGGPALRRADRSHPLQWRRPARRDPRLGPAHGRNGDAGRPPVP